MFIIHADGLDFMELVKNYYKDTVTARQWMKPDDDQRTILALQTKIIRSIWMHMKLHL